jgi:hypothetical protein
MSENRQYEFFLLRYVPDAVKNEFVNIGVVLVEHDSSYAEVRLTGDWRRVRCLDPNADIELLEGLERDIRTQLAKSDSRAQLITRLHDSFSNLVQVTEAKGCLGDEPALQLETLARMYLQTAGAGARREIGERQRIVTAMRGAFDQAGVWKLMRQDIRAAEYTHAGDPLKIDCGYRPNGVIKMFQGMALKNGIDAAKVLAFSYPQIEDGIKKKEAAGCNLTAVVEGDLDRGDEAVAFALVMLEQSRIGVATVEEMPRFAEVARRELRL